MGHHNIRFNGDRYANSGVWGHPTSRANFCEEDYAVTFYIAEFINSLTNIVYVYLGLRAMYGPGRRWLAPNWDFMSVSLVILGICSFLFHASLRQTMEFADELSMFVLLWSMLHTTLCIRQTAARRHLISVCLAVAMLSFSAFYIWSAKIIYHVVSFFVGLFGVACRTEYLFFWAADPSFPRDMAQVWNKRALEAALISVVGYGLWTIDLEYCDVLRASRDVGLPWAWLLEFHGWWHVLTAVGADRFMTVAREVRAQTEVGKDKRKRT